MIRFSANAPAVPSPVAAFTIATEPSAFKPNAMTSTLTVAEAPTAVYSVAPVIGIEYVNVRTAPLSVSADAVVEPRNTQPGVTRFFAQN